MVFSLWSLPVINCYRAVPRNVLKRLQPLVTVVKLKSPYRANMHRPNFGLRGIQGYILQWRHYTRTEELPFGFRPGWLLQTTNNLICVLQNASLDSYSGTVGLNCYLQHIGGGGLCTGGPGSLRGTGLVLNCKSFEPMQLTLLTWK